MAHELEMTKNGAAMAYVGDKPWHGLGVKLAEGISPVEMMKAAQLDWTVEKKETFVKLGNEEVYAGRDALVRTSDNKILDIVGQDWNPVQNEEAFQFFDDFVKKGNMSMDTAGSLRDGNIVWAMAKINHGFDLFGGDEVKGYLLFTNPHQYGKSIDVRNCMERVVCNNTLTMALAEKGKKSVKINHRSVFDADRVKAVLGVAEHKIDEFKQKAEFIGSKKYQKTDITKYVGEIFGLSEVEGKTLSRTGEKVLEIIDTQPGAKYAEGTFWQLFNAVTYTTDHLLGREDSSRVESAWFGQNSLKKLKALELAIDMAKKV